MVFYVTKRWVLLCHISLSQFAGVNRTLGVISPQKSNINRYQKLFFFQKEFTFSKAHHIGALQVIPLIFPVRFPNLPLQNP